MIPVDAWSMVRWCIAFLHLAAGLLIALRAPLRVQGAWGELAYCVPAIASAGWVFSFAGDTRLWPPSMVALFAGSTLWTIVSLCYLGNSFAVLPSLRTIKVHGPYRLVRHPAYLGELGLLSSCVLATLDNSAARMGQGYGLPSIAFLLAVGAIVVRIWIEERVLHHCDRYRTYCESTRWRLLPHVW